MLETALQRARFNQKGAARLLGLTYHQFRGLYRQYQKGMSNEE
jgi:psp operon transcriptional activator